MTDQIITCPTCKGTTIQRYGKTKSGAQRYRCTTCNHQFVPGSDYMIAPEIKATVMLMILADGCPRKIFQTFIKDGIPQISLRWIYELKRKAKNG